MAVTHKFTIICDDIRREDNLKIIILGMYVGTITVTQFPVVLPNFALLLMFESDRPEKWSWRLAIQQLERGRTVLEARGFLETPQPGPIVMPVKFGGVRFDEGGAYQVIFEQEGQREPIAITPFNIVLTLPPNPALQQPQFPRG